MPIAEPLFRIDTHVHTGRYSQCAELLDPYQIETWAVRAGLAGVVITEHDILWQDEELELLRESSPLVKVYRGIEVSAQGCHLVVIGLDDAGPLVRGISLVEVTEYTSAAGGAVVLAHPFRDGDPRELPLELIDAVEVGSTSFTKREAAASRRLARRLGKPGIAASDAHALSRVGWAWTEFPSLPADEKELASAIRSDLGRAVTPYRFPG
jgi:predicted metal-dependent phosphoesterase TrpH